MRRLLLVAAVVLIADPGAALAGDRTYADDENGFSLTFPEDWQAETPSLSSIKLKIRAPDNSLICRAQVSPLDPYVAQPGEDPRTIIEKKWTLDNWKAMYGSVYTAIELSNDGVRHLTDGYPARGVDMDYQMGKAPAAFYGHSRIVMTFDAKRLATVTCDVMADSIEETTKKWQAATDQSERVLASFALLEP